MNTEHHIKKRQLITVSELDIKPKVAPEIRRNASISWDH
jgi:hypothetical protein